MRYTTIIDITEFPALYRNPATRLVYLHLCLRSGYHDYDRDISSLSIRRLAYETGLSIGAVRNALEQLTKFQMIARQGQLTKVRKFILEQPISKRAQTKKQEAAQKARQQRQAEQRQAAAAREERQKNVDAWFEQGKTPYMVYYEEQLAKAQAGDQEAATFCAQQEHVYKMHQQSILKLNQKAK